MDKIAGLIAQRVKQLFDLDVEVILTRPDEQFGDFSTNVALQIAGRVGKSPRAVAEQIVEDFANELVEKTSIAGPGFINLTLTDKALYGLVDGKSKKQRSDQTIVIETNNPNPFKAMHIGHAFNSILGDTIANLLEQSGAKIYRVSYHGDVGLHVGRSMYSMLKFVDGKPEKLDGVAPEERNSFMSKMYAEGSKAYKEGGKVKDEIDDLAKMSFTREDPVYAKVYDTIFDWSFEQIAENVARLSNKPTHKRFLESDAEHRGVKIVRDNTPGVFVESEGALVFKGSEHGSFDNVFVGKNGNGLYAARDLGLIQLKNEEYHPDKSYIVTAEEQKAYFVGVLAAAGLAMPNLKDQTVNISTGTVKLSSGKMSSRDGDVVEIAWLFEQVAEAIKDRGGNPEEYVVAGALRYEFLKVRIGGDVVFDIDQAVSIQGNSGPYLQYAHARARSILDKVAEDIDSFDGELEPDERSLLRKIGQYSSAVELATAELMPHHICTYLYELAQEFNSFYEKNRVIGDARQAVRLGLVDRYATRLKAGLEILGIEAPDRM